MPLAWVLLLAAAGVLLMGATKKAWGYVNGARVQLELGPIGGGLWLRKDAARAYLLMREAAARDGVELLPSGPRSAFRTTEQQESLQTDRADYAAPVNRSPHQAGIAIDLDLVEDATGKTRPAKAWLAENAWRWGFVDPVAREPWHWEYRP